MKKFIKTEYDDFALLMKSLPISITISYVVSCIFMNLLASREIVTPFNWLVLDCGFSLSWVSFLNMDIVTKRYGPKASIELSIFAEIVNLTVCIVNFFVIHIPGNWSEYYNLGPIANEALDNTFKGTWYVIVGSTLAMIISTIVDSNINYHIGKFFNHTSQLEFILRSYVSTFFGQFVDNLVFAFFVSYVFFGWTILQCIICSFVAGIVELVCEMLFNPLGYKIVTRLERDKIGEEYISKHLH